MFNFKWLIDKYSKGQVKAICKGQGYYDMEHGGEWVEGEVEECVIISAAIVPLTNDELKFYEGGAMSADDRKLYCYYELRKGDEIENTMLDGSIFKYTILGQKNYSDFDRGFEKGLRIYFLKRIDRDDRDN